MKKTTTYFLLLMAIAASSFISCTDTLDLDNETLVLIDKQKKLEKLDALYDLSFTDPLKAESDYQQFVREELITETQNYLTNLDISNRNSMTSLAVRLNTNAFNLQEFSTNSLFELYKTKFENQMLNQSLYGELPQQLKKGDRLTAFQNKIKEVETLFENKITAFRTHTPVDETITGKQWSLNTAVFTFTPSFKIYTINFNFLLNTNRSMDITSFFFMPHIPKSGTLLGLMEETGFFQEEIAPGIISPYEYVVYDNKICFYFQFKNNYDPLTEKGKLAREWCYEYTYTLENGNLVLSNPRLTLYMPPIIRTTGYEDPIFQEEYPDGLKTMKLSPVL